MGRHKNPEQSTAPRFCLVCEIEIPKIRLASWSSYNRRETCSREHKAQLASTRSKEWRNIKTGEVYTADALTDALNKIARTGK